MMLFQSVYRIQPGCAARNQSLGGKEEVKATAILTEIGGVEGCRHGCVTSLCRCGAVQIKMWLLPGLWLCGLT